MSSVDVVVPCYNYAHYLEDCIDSILSQRDVAVRVLIVDDQSPDDTPAVATRIAERDSRVTYVRNEKNLGLIGTANRGLLAWARADYSLLLSADDALTPGALARAASIMDAHPEVDIVFGRALFLQADQRPFEVADAATPEFKIISSPDYIRYNFEVGNPAPSPTVALRTRAQHALGGYLPQFHHTSDMEMWIRFAEAGPVAVIRDVQALYHLHGASMSSATLQRAVSDRAERIETCEFVADRMAGKFPAVGGWLADLKRRLSDGAYWLAGEIADDTEERRACLAFADRHNAAAPLGAARLKYILKSRIGFLRQQARRVEAQPAKNAQMTDTEFGWWPE